MLTINISYTTYFIEIIIRYINFIDINKYTMKLHRNNSLSTRQLKNILNKLVL